MKSFFLQLNIRQLLIHFIGSWLFIYGVHTLASLYDYSFLYNESADHLRAFFADRFNTDLFIIQTAGYIGLIAAYIISWQQSVKKNWYWVNSVIVLLTAFVLYYFNLVNWKVIRVFLLAPGHLFPNSEGLPAVITNGVVMLALGCLLFFNKKIIAFIDKGVWREKDAATAKATNAIVK